MHHHWAMSMSLNVAFTESYYADELREQHAFFLPTTLKNTWSVICKVIICWISDLGRGESFAWNFVFRVTLKFLFSSPLNQHQIYFIHRQEEDGEVSQGFQQHGNISVKQRHPSSPMASPDLFDQAGHPPFKSRTSPYFQPHHPPGPEGTSSTGNPFFANQFYPFQTGFSGHKMASDPISRFVSFSATRKYATHASV